VTPELLALVSHWRETADIWERQLRDAPPYSCPKRKVEQPPQPGVAAILNWINWLRNCADQVEKAATIREQAK
jgi:hypothetical protein